MSIRIHGRPIVPHFHTGRIEDEEARAKENT